MSESICLICGAAPGEHDDPAHNPVWSDTTQEAAQPSGPRPLHVIASEIDSDWGIKVNYAARPYLDAMGELNKITDQYYADSAASIVRYFLANAGTWRGETARRVKAELKTMVEGVY